MKCSFALALIFSLSVSALAQSSTPTSTSTPALTPVATATAGIAVAISVPNDTAVNVKLAETISSSRAAVGQRIRFVVADNVVVNNHVVIPSGAVATAIVTKASPKKWAGRSGKLEIAMQDVTAIDGTKIYLSGTQGGSGVSHAGRMATGIVITSIFTFGGASLFLLMHGKDITIPEGTLAYMYTVGSSRVISAQIGQPVAADN